MSTGLLPSISRTDPIAHGRQLRSNYIYNPQWVPMDFGDLLSLLWRYDRSLEAGDVDLAAYYRAAWEALLKALAIDETDLGDWLLRAEGTIMPSLPAFVERQAPFSEDLLARAETVTHLFELREALLTFGADQTDLVCAPDIADRLQSQTLRQLINALFCEQLPAHIDRLLEMFVSIDELLHVLLLPWHPHQQQTLPLLVANYGFPDPDEYIDIPTG